VVRPERLPQQTPEGCHRRVRSLQPPGARGGAVPEHRGCNSVLEIMRGLFVLANAGDMRVLAGVSRSSSVESAYGPEMSNLEEYSPVFSGEENSLHFSYFLIHSAHRTSTTRFI